MTDTNNQYNQLINDMLSELNKVLDSHVVVRIARKVNGLKITDQGEVESVEGEPQAIVQSLVDEFIGLSNVVVITTLQPLLKQCPWIKVPVIEQKQ